MGNNSRVTVMKFGGGVLSTRQDYERAARIIAGRRAAGEQVAVVVSAVGGVTDWLIKNAAALPPAEIENYLVSLHRPIAEADYSGACRKLATKLASQNSDRGEYVNSFGERLSAMALAAVLNEFGVPAASFDAESAGIVCRGADGRAIADEAVTAANFSRTITPLLSDNVVVITGYYGARADGSVSTFGRGGSDYSAGLVAACLGAASLELWKNVDGFLTCDPRMVPAASFVPRLSYDEAQELGFFGAKILHPKTVIPLRGKSIPIVVKNVDAPERAGTVIGAAPAGSVGVAAFAPKSISFKRDVAVVYVHGEWLAEFPGLASLVFSAVNAAGVSVDMIATSEMNLCFTTSRQDAEKARAAVAAVPGISGASCRSDLALVSVIGDGLTSTSGVGGSVFSALGMAGVNVEMISNGASGSNLSFIVAESQLEPAVKAIHSELFEGEGVSVK